VLLSFARDSARRSFVVLSAVGTESESELGVVPEAGEPACGGLLAVCGDDRADERNEVRVGRGHRYPALPRRPRQFEDGLGQICFTHESRGIRERADAPRDPAHSSLADSYRAGTCASVDGPSFALPWICIWVLLGCEPSQTTASDETRMPSQPFTTCVGRTPSAAF
jgi:hypothetical protein